jgi:hypothetical protein
MTLMRWGMPPPLCTGGPPITKCAITFLRIGGAPYLPGAPPLALAKALLRPLPDDVLCGSSLPFSSLGRS